MCLRCAALKGSRAAADRPRPEPLQRFMAKVDVNGPGGCWLWQASTTKNGYGQFYYGGRMTEAHRVAWMLLRGEIPAGLQIDHLCRVRHCVNPNHMEPVTPRVNTLRGASPSAVNAARWDCVNGHALTADNVYEYQVGPGRVQRLCRICRRRRVREHQERMRAMA